MLGLALSASAVAGTQKAQRVSKTQPATVELVKKNPTKVKLAASNQFVKKTGFQVADEFKAKPQMFRAPVTDQPDGTVKYYMRTAGTGVWVDADSYYTPGDLAGMVMAVEDGNTIWFKNLLYDPDNYFETDYWIKGTKSGTRITINMGQGIETFGSYGDCQLKWGTVAISNNSLVFTASNSNSCRFDVGNDGALTLYGTSTVDDGYGYSGTGLGCYLPGYSSTYFMGFMEYGLVLTPVDPSDLPEEPTIYTDADIEAMTGGEEVAYYRTGEAFFYDGGIYMGSQGGSAYIYYDADGSTVYMRNPVYGWNNGTWVKGTVSGNKITVPLGQYLAWTSNFIGLKTAWGEVVFPTDTTVAFTQDPSVTEVTYTIDGNKITLDGTSEYVGLATIMDSARVDLEDNWYPNLDYSTIYFTVPAAPTAVTATPASTTAVINWTDEENQAWNLRYRPYQEGGDSYFNDFNDYGSDTFLDDWYVWDSDGDGYNWGVINMGEGNYALYSASYDNDTYSALSPDNWLVSAAVPLTGSVSFIAFGVDANYAAEHFQVYLYPNADPEWESEDDFVALSDIIVADADREHQYTFNIPAEYQGQTGRIAIRHYDISDMFLLVVDDFYVGDPDFTPAPWTVVENVTNPYTIEGLTPETTYEVQVQGINEGGVGSWSESTLFTTLPATIRGDADDNGSVNIADVTCLIRHLLSQQWDNVPGEFNYDNADCDLSGQCTIGDVTTLIHFLLSHEW